MGASPFPYIVPVLPRPLPEELVKGEHFILADLLKSIPGSSLQAGSAQEPQAQTARETLTTFVRPDQSPLAKQDPQPAPQATKKKKRKKWKKVVQAKATSAGLESFVNLVNPSPLIGEIRGVCLVSEIANE